MSSSAAGSLTGLSPVRRIAVLRPNHRLGNLLLLTPLIQELEARFPGAEIEVVGGGLAGPAVFAQFPLVTALHAFPARSYQRPGRVLRLLHALRQPSYDLAIDPMPRSRSGRFLLALVRARTRIGFRWGVGIRDFVLTHAVDPAGAPAHFAQAPLYLLRTALLADAAQAQAAQTSPIRPLALRLTQDERRSGAQRLAAALGRPAPPVPPCVGIFAHASGDKCFPADWWGQIVASLRRQAPSVPVVEFIPADGRRRLADDLPALQTPDLRLLGAALASTSVLVSGDCGIMHLADAAGARVMGLFKATEPARYAPSGPVSEGLWARDAKVESMAARIMASL
ncbi:MAG TPA: glycosyltransferase family 9 protein [Steroidobacteraceae bacterium]